MQTFYLYRLSFTGATEWRLVRADRLGAAAANARPLMVVGLLPRPAQGSGQRHLHSTVTIASARCGPLTCEFDCEAPPAPGQVRRGRAGNGAEVFTLQRQGAQSLLTLRGCPPIQVCGGETVTFAQQGRQIARITDAPSVHIEDAFTQADCVKRLEIAPEFVPVLEILAAFVELGPVP